MVAAYVGDTAITEDQVTEIVEDLGQKLEELGQPGNDSGASLPSRDHVLTVLVVAEVCERVSAEEGYRPREQASAEAVSQESGFPADASYVQHRVELATCLSGIPSDPSVAPTEEEMADLLARAREVGAIRPETSDEDAVKMLDGEQLRSALSFRNILADAATRHEVTINPRYSQLEFPILNFGGAGGTAVSLLLGASDSGAVADRS